MDDTQAAGYSSRFIIRRALFCALIALVTAAAFSPVVHNGFVNFDDGLYVTANRSIRSFSLDHIEKQFTSSIGYFQPVTMLTLMADYALHGLNPAGYHVTSLLFHILNALIVFALVAALAKSDYVALLAALLFSVHPLRVESVAWVAERKDVVSSLFYFAALWAYVKFLDTGRRRLYFGCLALFVLSLLSKPMAVSLPLVLLLLDYLRARPITVRAVVGKWPFFAIAAIFSVLAYVTQSHYGALTVQANAPLMERVALPFYGILFYLYKTVVPLHLCVLYPPDSSFSANAFLYVVLAAAAAVAAFLIGRRSRSAAFGMLFYLITLLPVLQIVAIGRFIVAERYAYVPMVGMYYLVALGCRRLYRMIRPPIVRGGFVVAISLTLLLLSALTVKRCAVWRDSSSLWNDALSTHPSGLAYANLGSILIHQGKEDDGIALYRKALAIDPGYPLVHLNLGGTLLRAGKVEQAIVEFRESLRGDPDCAQTHNSLGNALMMAGAQEEALTHFRRAVAIEPDFASAQHNLGLALMQSGRSGEAIEPLRKALASDSASGAVHHDLGTALLQAGNLDEAALHLQRAAELDPGNGSDFCTLGMIYLKKAGGSAQAIACLHRSLSLGGENLVVLNGLAQAFLQTGQIDSAIAVSQQAAAIARASGQEAIVQVIEKDICRMRQQKR